MHCIRMPNYWPCETDKLLQVKDCLLDHQLVSVSEQTHIFVCKTHLIIGASPGQVFAQTVFRWEELPAHVEDMIRMVSPPHRSEIMLRFSRGNPSVVVPDPHAGILNLSALIDCLSHTNLSSSLRFLRNCTGASAEGKPYLGDFSSREKFDTCLNWNLCYLQGKTCLFVPWWLSLYSLDNA